MDIKIIFNKDYISREDYKTIFQELYDEFGDVNIRMKISDSVVYQNDTGDYYYLIDSDLTDDGHRVSHRVEMIKNYLEKKKSVKFFKKTVIKVDVKLRDGKAIRLDTFKLESEIRLQCAKLIEFCLSRLDNLRKDGSDEGVSVYEDNNYIEFSTIRKIEFTKEETIDLIKLICHES